MVKLIHRKTHEQPLDASSRGGSVWRTCLRQIHFLDSQESAEVSASDEFYENEKALAFLMEILCGLDSPIVGETEVFGQFKNFLDENNINTPWSQFLLREVKALRAEHLIGIGAHSYGSLIRKHTKNFSGVSIVGSGHLAQEILPWVSHKRDLKVHVRDLEKAKTALAEFKNVQYSGLESSKINSALIIAAPISNEQLMNFFNTSDVTELKVIYDLRGESVMPFDTPVERVSLDDFFAQLNQKKNEKSKTIEMVRALIAAKAQDYMNRMDHRPKGWDDLFA